MPESSREEIAKLEALYANNPEGRVFTHLAEAYRKTGDLEKARNILEQGLARHAGYASAHVVLGRVLMDQQNSDEASGAFRRALDLDPHNRIALHSLGDLSRQAGNRDEALQYYEQLRQLEPNNEELGEIIAGLTAAPADEAPVPEVWEPEVADQGSADFEQAHTYNAAAQPESVTEPQSQPEPEHESASEPEPYPLPIGEIVPPEQEAPAEQEASTSPSGFDWLPTDDLDFGLPGDLAGLSEAQSDGPSSPPAEPAEEAFVFDDFSLAMGTSTGDEPELGIQPESIPELFSDPEFDPALETAVEPTASFEPEPELEPEPVAEVEPEPEPTGEVLTETIAELYSSQGLHDRAADVYRALLRQRPGDAALEAKLQDSEARATPSFEEAAPAFEPTAPEAIDDHAHLDSEAWLAGGAGTADSQPTPYAWSDQAAAATEDHGPAIRTYFERLLAYRAKQVEPSGAEEESFLELETIEPPPPPRIQSPVEVPVPAPNAVYNPAQAGPPASAGPMDSGDAFDAWFDEPVPEESAPSAPAAAPPAQVAQSAAVEPPAPPPAELPPVTTSQEPAVEQAEPSAGTGADDDDDLEMFRSWLQSLKK